MKINKFEEFEIKQMLYTFVKEREHIFNFENEYISDRMTKIMITRLKIYMTDKEVIDMLERWQDNLDIVIFYHDEAKSRFISPITCVGPQDFKLSFKFLIEQEHLDQERAQIERSVIAAHVGIDMDTNDEPRKKRRM